MKHEHVLGLALAKAAEDRPAPASPLAGTSATFTNELGSTAQFTFEANRGLSGTYTSLVSGAEQAISGPITGWYDQHVITWSVLWPTNPPSLTSWVGEFLTDRSIETLWYLVDQTRTPGDPREFWTAINAGTDTFRPR